VEKPQREDTDRYRPAEETRGEPHVTPSTDSPPVDGRSARRERNSDAVLDAVHELFVERRRIPNVEEVAARAGVSLRSVYRYFPDTGQLMAAAVARRTRAVEQDWVLVGLGEGSLDERIDRFVDHRLSLHESSGPTIRAAFALSDSDPVIAAQVERRRSQVAEQTRQHFARELTSLPSDSADAVLRCIEVLGQFESMEQLRTRQGLSRARTHEVMATGIRALLTTR
jgi:AcrR family transcriptional regulator